MGKNNYIKCALFLIIIGFLPVFVSNQYYLSVLVFAGIYAIVAIGLSMLMGYAGQISLGHAGFFAIGGYTSAILTKFHNFHPLQAMIIGIVFTVFAALLVGLPSLRLRGHYLAMATLGFGEIIYVTSGAATGLTEGPSGFSGVPSIALAGFTIKSELSKFYLVWLVALIIMILSLNIIHSRIGRALRSIHGDEIASNAMGVNVAKYKIQVFVYSAALASIAGSLYVHHMRFVSPTGFNLNKSILFLIMIMSGGMGSLWGAVIGAAIFTLLPEFLGVFNDYDILMYGAILLGMMMFLPHGLTGLTTKIIQLVLSKWKTRTQNNP
ncbi:MAG: branched-chain amino acid ABC transporter permease [Candidatus Latescibacteria bacterium]|nr:branched-chain amino acid ABC transporter permease [Candidatus Latescibacterota bacterium]